MDTILDALQEGRLIELPDHDKEHALKYLAHVIEAIPSIPPGTDVDELVKARENIVNTGLGRGWACPHARVDFEEDLMCVVGWSPGGIDYGSPDGKPVNVIAMFLVPSNQRDHYLREVSILAKALMAQPDRTKLNAIKDLNDVRNYLLDLISTTKDFGPDARARMIRLQARPALEALPAGELANLMIESLLLVSAPNLAPVILAQNAALSQALDGAVGLVEKIDGEGVYQSGPWRIIRRAKTVYQHGRATYDCLAITTSRPAATK